MITDQLFSEAYIEYASKATDMLKTFQPYFQLNESLWKRYSQGLIMPSIIKITTNGVFISDDGCRDVVFPTTIIDNPFNRKTVGMFHVMEPKVLQHKTIQMLIVMMYLRDEPDKIDQVLNQLDSFQINSLVSLYVKLFGEINMEKIIARCDDNVITLQFRRVSDTFCELSITTIENYIDFHIKCEKQLQDLFDRHRCTLSISNKIEIYKNGFRSGYNVNILNYMFREIIQDSIIKVATYGIYRMLEMPPPGMDLEKEIYVIPTMKKFNVNDIANIFRYININNIKVSYIHHLPSGTMFKHINLLAYQLLKEDPDLDMIFYLLNHIDINQTTYDDDHIIFVLYEKKKFDMIDILLKNTSINIHATDKRNKSCFYYACKEHNSRMMKLFKDHGAVVDFDINEISDNVRCKLRQMDIITKMSQLNM